LAVNTGFLIRLDVLVVPQKAGTEHLSRNATPPLKALVFLPISVQSFPFAGFGG
jgi:hypothetical protein